MDEKGENEKPSKGRGLGHLGIVATKINEIGIVDYIDSFLPIRKDRGAKTTHGLRVKALLLDFLSAGPSSLYGVSSTFDELPTLTLFFRKPSNMGHLPKMLGTTSA